MADSSSAEPSGPDVDAPGVASNLIVPGLVLESGPHGSYTLEKRLGRGANGEVWKAKQKGVAGFSQSGAIKFFRPDRDGPSEQHFIDEARLLSLLHHGSIARVHHFFPWRDTHVLVMEYVQGQTLWSLLQLAKRKGRRLSEPVVCEILGQVADALHHAYMARDDEGQPLYVVHRDVKATNVIISNDGSTKLLDFGMAFSTLKDRLETTSPVSGKGKPDDEKRVRLDWFDLGTLLVEMLTGTSPYDSGFDGNSSKPGRVTPKLVDSITPGVSRRMKDICRRLLVQAPLDRYSSADEVAEALGQRTGGGLGPRLVRREVAMLEALPDATAPFPSASPGFLHLSRRMALVAMVAVVALALGLALLFGYTSPPESGELTPRIAKTESAPGPKGTSAVQPPNPPGTTTVAARGSATVNEERKNPEAENANVGPPDGVLRAKPRKLTPVERCVRNLAASALVLTAACTAHVSTGLKAGDCTGKAATPAREVNGLKIPDYFLVELISLNGEGCRGERNGKSNPLGPPCPAGEGRIVVELGQGQSAFGKEPRWVVGETDGPPHLQRQIVPRLSGQAYFEKGAEKIPPVNFHLAVIYNGRKDWPTTHPTDAIGRLTALFTELHMPDGTSVPVCGVLFQDPNLGGLKEGIPVFAPGGYPGALPTAPSTWNWWKARVKFFWPPE
jgi:hypothetical protein